jgi:hypothetical protein
VLVLVLEPWRRREEIVYIYDNGCILRRSVLGGINKGLPSQFWT